MVKEIKIMMCYKDMAFCGTYRNKSRIGSDCVNSKCPRYFSEEDHVNAKRWWENDDYPVAFTDLSESCSDYIKGIEDGS